MTKANENSSTVEALAQRLSRESEAREEAARIAAAFGEASPITDLAARARALMAGEDPEKANPLNADHRRIVDAALASIEGAALLDRERLWIANGLAFVIVVAPYDPLGNVPNATAFVAVAEAHVALAEVAALERRLFDAYQETARREQAQRAEALERELEAERASRAKAARDEPFHQLPVTAAAALHIAAETSGATRKAFMKFAELAASEALGAPEKLDDELAALASRLAGPCRERTEAAARRDEAATAAAEERQRLAAMTRDVQHH